MFQSFTFKNFRCFRDFKLDSLARVNLIAGQNNVGKTALLQSIFLYLNPENPDLGPSFPGLGDMELLDRMMFEENFSIRDIWEPLFVDYDTTKIIELASEDDKQYRYTLLISLAERENIPPEHEIRLEYYDKSDSIPTLYMTIPGKRHTRPADFPPVIFLSTRPRTARADAVSFSKLELVGRQDEVVSILKLLEPRLRRLAVLDTGRLSIIHADIGIGKMLQIPMAGEGMNRLLSIAVAIANTEHGVVLIDEIENGLHYSVMTKVWAAIAQAARAADVQIFATTHSWECITAAHEAFSSSAEYDFRLHRLDRVGEDIQAVTLDQEMLDTAIKAGLEVR